MMTSIRSLVAATALAGGMASTPVLADETDPPGVFTIAGNLALVTDYRFRGLSQSKGDSAVQGGVTVSHADGVYVGAWSSSIAFDAPLDGVYGSQEVDLFGGWTGPIGSGLTADLGLLHYAYPGGRVGKAEFFEPYASISATLGPATARLGVNYAWKQRALDLDADGRKDDDLYLHGELSAGIPNTPLTLSGHLGYTDGALSPRFATRQTARYDGGLDWNLGASYALTRNLSVSGQYVGVEGNGIEG